jgi:predicted DNA-binding ArsR family transcriptional regulator
MYFSYNGSIVDKNSTFINLANLEDKQRNKISILANDDESMEQSNEPILNKSRYIICPTCRENIRIKIQDYKIELYDC